jgi:hypothetical protein
MALRCMKEYSERMKRLLHFLSAHALLVALIILVFTGFFTVFLHRINLWEKESYLGTVTRMTGEGFVISDPRRREQHIDVEQTTRFRLGRHDLSRALLPGDTVIVIGVMDDRSHVDATLVRVLERGGAHTRKETLTD